MRYVYLTLLPVTAAFCLSATLTFWLTDPTSGADEAQSAIVDQYVSKYCAGKPLDESIERWIGETSALARVAIRGGLGTLVLAETAKCKVGLSR